MTFEVQKSNFQDQRLINTFKTNPLITVCAIRLYPLLFHKLLTFIYIIIAGAKQLKSFYLRQYRKKTLI